MPIICSADFHAIGQAGFKSIDYQVMGQAFKTHSFLGRFFDESICSHDLAHRLEECGMSVQREVAIDAVYETFTKRYKIDLLIDGSIPYELKTVDFLHEKHDSQLLNYLFLLDLQHGKLLNFRSPSLQGRFISTNLTPIDRRKFTLTTRNWVESTASMKPIVGLLNEILHDWGAFLSIELYSEAIIALVTELKQPHPMVQIKRGDRLLGNQSLPLITPDVMLHTSACSSRGQFRDQRRYLKRLLELTEVNQAQWINFNQHEISLETIK